MMKKIKGEITTQQIVLLIILLVSFSIILFLLFRLDIGKESDKEICHNSVVMKGLSVVPSEAVPLKCSRTYVCITKDGSCEKMTSPEIVKAKTKDEVYKALAEEMANCWWMFGEGKVDYVGKDLAQNLYCSICSQIVLDDSISDIKEFNGIIEQKDFYASLEKIQMVDKNMNYLEYLTSYSTFSSFENYMNKEGTTFGNFEFNKPYFVMMGINSVVGVWKWAGIGTVGLGLIAAPFTGGYSLGISALIIGGSGTVGGIGGYFIGTTVKGDGIENEFLRPVIMEADANSLKKFGCEDILTST